MYLCGGLARVVSGRKACDATLQSQNHVQDYPALAEAKIIADVYWVSSIGARR